MAEDQPRFIGIWIPVEQSCAIGIDLGATKIAAALVCPDGSLLSEKRVDTPIGSTPAILDQIASLVNDLLETSPGRVCGLGIGSPGLVNSATGIVRAAINLGWEEVALKDEICRRLLQPLPVWIQKDANANALGEYYFGSAKGCEDFIFIGIGSGLGAGLMVSGRLVVGSAGSSAG
jgi:glucokinase